MVQTIEQPQTADPAKLCGPTAFIKNRTPLHGLSAASAARQRLQEAQQIQQSLTRCSRELFQQGQRQRAGLHRRAQRAPGAEDSDLVDVPVVYFPYVVGIARELIAESARGLDFVRLQPLLYKLAREGVDADG